MVSPLFNQDGRIHFEPENHIYTDTKTGKVLRSVSSVLNGTQVPFNRDQISLAMAKGNKQKQQEILAEWDMKLTSSHVRGNWIHENLESYALYGKYDTKLEPVVQSIMPMFKEAYRFYVEALVYSTRFGISGQTDLVFQRQKGNQSVFDFWDYKTNESKGIVFDSINRKKDPWKHYNQYFLPPLDHLEDCNYHRYALQLSLYAFMAADTWDIRIGKLGIIFIDNNLIVLKYPVPYMKMEVEQLLIEANALKALPAQKLEAEDDW